MFTFMNNDHFILFKDAFSLLCTSLGSFINMMFIYSALINSVTVPINAES